MIVLDEDNYSIGDTGVIASIQISRIGDSHVVLIMEWSSLRSGCGNTNRALEILRGDFPGTITAQGIGSPGDRSHAYWCHQLRMGRVDFLLDDGLKSVTL